MYSEHVNVSTDTNTRATHSSRVRDDSSKKVGNASSSGEGGKRNMDSLAQGEHFESKDSIGQEKASRDNKDGLFQRLNWVLFFC